MHWRFLSDTEVKFLAIFANAPGWVAIAFPESSGQMEPADGVIGRASTVRPYRLTSKTLPVCHHTLQEKGTEAVTLRKKKN